MKKYRLKSFYAQLVILVIALTTALAVVSVSILYFLRDNMLDREREVQETNLEYAVEQLDLVMNNAYHAIYSIAGNEGVNHRIFTYDGDISSYAENSELMDLISKIHMVYIANESIKEVFIVHGSQDYVFDQNGIISKSRYFKVHFGEDAGQWMDLMEEKHLFTVRMNPENSSMYVLYSLYYKNEFFATLCIELDMDAFQSRNMFQEFVRERIVCIIDQDGQIVGYLSENQDDETVCRAMQRDDIKDYLIHTGSTMRERLRVVALTPYKLVTGEITVLFTTLLLGFVGLSILGCVVAICIAKGIYRPLYHAAELIATAGSRGGENELVVIRDNINIILEQNRGMSTIVNHSTPIVLETMFRRLISNADSDKDLEELSEMLSIEVRAGYYMAVVVYTEQGSNEMAEALRAGSISDVVSLFRRNQDEYVIILYMSRDTDREVILKQCKNLRKHIEAVIAAGKVYNDVYSVGKSYQDAVRALEERCANADETEVFDADYEYQWKGYQLPNNIESILYDYITTGNCMMVRDTIADSLQKNLENGVSFKEYKQLVRVYDLFLSRVYENMNASIQEKICMTPATENAYSMKDVREQVEIMLNNYIDLTERLRDELHTDIMERILHYIDANLQRDIGLDDIAQEVHLTPNYITKYFKAKNNMNFKEYITLKRIDKAKELLKNSEMKIKDIALACGYNSSKQFLVNFAKIAGITPTEYRRKWRN